MKLPKILIIGSNGQLGTVLTKALIAKYGEENVLSTDLFAKTDFEMNFEILDATNYELLNSIVKNFGITQIYHLAAILSANGEQNPLKTWDINMKTWLNVLEVSRLSNIDKVFFPSSIAVFGEGINRDFCQQNSPLIPATVYGNSKVAGENWAFYYNQKYDLDIRSVRYPGIIGHQSKPGGGTTDYAVDIFHKAIDNEVFNCFLSKETMLPMIYIDDAINATLALMEAPKQSIKIRTSYNLAGLSFTPNELHDAIRKEIPSFTIKYKPDFRQNIADSWPKRIDDTDAKNDWGWYPHFNLNQMVEDMIFHLAKNKVNNKAICI